MKKAIVIYQSKYGATKKYAEWLSEKLNCEMVEKSKCKIETLNDYDVIIYGGGIYATGIAGFSFIKKSYNKLKDKKFIVFAVGASPYDESAVLALKERNFIRGMYDLPCFYFRGTFDESVMTIGDKILIGMLKKAVSKKNPSQYETWEKALMESIDKPGDWTSKEYLTPILEYLNDNIE